METKLNKEIYPVDIVMVTWHRQEITRKTIMGIYQNTKRENFRLIVIDNASPAEMREMLTKMHSDGLIDKLIFNSQNRGLEPARNQGLTLVESEYFICADNDCIPQKPVDGKDWVEMLVDLMENNPEYAAISSRTQVMIGSGNIFDGHEDDDIVEFPHPGGSLRIMTKPTVLDAGKWREDSQGRGAEERWICGKLHELGWKTAFAVKVKCYHQFGDRSQDTDRWGYKDDWKPEDTGHSDIWHPALANGDDPEEVKKYLDEE